MLLCASFYSTLDNNFRFMISDLQDISNNEIAFKDFTFFKEILEKYSKETLNVNSAKPASKSKSSINSSQKRISERSNQDQLSQLKVKNCWLALLYLILTTKITNNDVILFLKYPSIHVILDLLKNRNIARLCKLVKNQINKIKKSPVKATIDIFKTKNNSFQASNKTISVSNQLNDIVMITEDKSLENTASNNTHIKSGHESSYQDLYKNKQDEILDYDNNDSDKNMHSETSYLNYDNNINNEVKSLDLYRIKIENSHKKKHKPVKHSNTFGDYFEQIQQRFDDNESFSITQGSSSSLKDSNEQANSDKKSDFIE